MEESQTTEKAIIHIVVVGFHHKKGCQVEYSYPPLIKGESQDSPKVPEEWKCLPFLALPDGAHNYDDDTIYFHLPPRSDYTSKTTVYGVSCYRQISTHLLKRKDDDVTRETVQKSVVVLSQMPIYGILHAKLQMITQAYFEEKDFAKNDILKELFVHVNLSISASSIDDAERFLGLSARSLVMQFKHKVLMLFKLILLERRVLFFSSPVRKLVGGIMALLSLYPDMIERGLAECTMTLQEHTESITNKLENAEACNNYYNESTAELDNAMSDFDNASENQPNLTSSLSKDNDSLYSEKNKSNEEETTMSLAPSTSSPTTKEGSEIRPVVYDDDDDGIVLSSLSTNSDLPVNSKSRHTSSSIWNVTSETALNLAASVSSKLENLSSALTTTLYSDENNENSRRSLSISEIEDDDDNLTSSFGNSRLEIKSESPARSDLESHLHSTKPDVENPGENVFHNDVNFDKFSSLIHTNEHGFPLTVFTRGYLCLPYVSLQQFGDLKNNMDRGYVVGATNILFKTQMCIADVIVDTENASLEIRDNSLKRLLHLTSADLRFADNLLKNVNGNQIDDVFLDATGWEGGDEWIQAQFMDYLTSLLAVSASGNSKEAQDFNESFIAAWKKTENYRFWLAGDHDAINEVRLSHPFQAQYSVSDVRLRIHHNLQSTDRGKKIEDAMSSANQAVSSTGRYMSSAFGSAKSSVTSWWSSKVKKDT